jgi:hypothetical protein
VKDSTLTNKILGFLPLLGLIISDPAFALNQDKKSGAFVTGAQLVDHLKKNKFFYSNQKIATPNGALTPIQPSNCKTAVQALNSATLAQGHLNGYAVNSKRAAMVFPSGPKMVFGNNKNKKQDFTLEKGTGSVLKRVSDSDAFEISCVLSNGEHRMGLIAVEGPVNRPASWFIVLSAQNEVPDLKLEQKAGARSRVYTINEAIYRIGGK